MGRRRAPRALRATDPRPPGRSATADRPAAPAPGGRPGVPGMPRPNPAMMPRQASGQLGGGPAGPGAARPAGGAPAAGGRGPPRCRWRSRSRPVPVAVPAVRRPVAVVAVVVAVAPRVRSVGPEVRPGVVASPRSSAVKSSTRWRRRRSVASGSSPGDGPEGPPRPRRLADRPGREDRRRRLPRWSRCCSTWARW